MKKRFKVGLYGLLLLFTVVLLVEQMSFAGDKIEAVYKSADGKYGISRVKMATKNLAKSMTREEVLSSSLDPAEVLAYCAFTADKTPTDYSDGDVDLTDVTYTAWNKKHKNYLIGAFGVINKKSKVQVIWELDGATMATEVIEDPLATNGRLLLNYWYFAWYKTVEGDFTLSGNVHDFKVRVSICKDNGDVVSGTEKEDSCKFRTY